MIKYDIVIPALRDDAEKVLNNIEYINKYISYKNIVLIGNDEVKSIIKKYKFKNIKFINENELIDGLNFKTIKLLIIKKDECAVNRTGWYLQQFLKLAYSYKCNDDFYLCWDSDTIPVKEVIMYDNQPIFHMKKEYHVPYFNTIRRLLNIEKYVNKSFISEHMLFKCEYVKKMIEDIEKNKSIKGKIWYEKIINAIDTIDLKYSGFSEFETYGTYVMTKYDKYRIVDWKSLREGSFYVKQPLDENQIIWLSKEYNSVSFEKHDTLTWFSSIWNNKFHYKFVSINFTTTIMWPYMMFRKYVLKTINNILFNRK